MKNAVSVCVCCALVVFYCGCISSKPHQSALMQSANMNAVSTNELRINARALARPFGGILEGAADYALMSFPGPEIEYKVLRWKTEVIPAMHAALFNEDPLAALIDAGALIEQLDLYFSEGPGVNELDADVISVIRTGNEAMRRQVKKVLVDAGPSQQEVDRFWVRLEEWARENPVKHTFAMRPSTTSLVAHFVAQTGGGIGNLVVGLQEQVSDLGARIDLHAEYLPRQARWQAQLAAEEMLTDRVFERAVNQLGEGVPVKIAELPIDIAAERDAILDIIRTEGLLIGSWVEKERDVALQFVTNERLAILDAVSQERLAILETVAEERKIVLGMVIDEREKTLKELEELVEVTLHQAVIEVVDHAFLRVMQLLAIVLPLFFIAGLVLVWVLRRRPSDG